jgi:DNA repair exonuclease SbcCD ATPase subunit
MQIQSIEVEGFWSYRDPQRIDIGNLPLVAGVGENGAGKSALLVSAVVAALYGKLPTSTADESITTGMNEGRVSVEFTIDGTLYRVGRKYTRGGSSHTGGVWVHDAGTSSGWRAISEKNPTAVTAKVVELLGMTYDTASMTWVAAQGEYGKFSAALPSQRFKLLSGIYDLDRYAPKAKAAGEKAKTAATTVATLTGRVSEIHEGLLDDEAEDEVATGLAALTDDELVARTKANHQEIDRLTQELADLNAADPARQTVEARQALELARNARLAQLREAENALARARQDRERATMRANALRQGAETRYEQTVASVKYRAAEAREGAEKALSNARTILAQISDTEGTLPHLREAATGHQQQAESARAAADALSTRIADETRTRDTLLAEWNTLKVKKEEITGRIAMLQDAAGHDTKCYECGTHLTPEVATALITSQQQELATIEARMLVVKSDGGAGKQRIIDLTTQREAHLSTVDQQAAQARDAQAVLARAEALIAGKAERKQAELDANTALARVVDDEAEQMDVAADQRQVAIDAADAEEAAAVGAAVAAEQQANADIAASSAPTADEVTLEQAFNDAQARIADGADAIARQRAEYEAKRAELREEGQVLGREAVRRHEVANARKEQQERLTALQQQLTDAKAEQTLYESLEAAYKPTGIPAMILAGVVEELNEAVNQSLQRLSDGELSVEIRASRETKSGSTENKVFVYVSTPTGTRAYETLSGGQKFRVDLAIRTGLGQVIARSTGTPIRTFILDEGWGSLDERGILSTIETLFRLSEDVNVITVSHIDRVQSEFPSRVEVSLVGGSSVAEVVTG